MDKIKDLLFWIHTKEDAKWALVSFSFILAVGVGIIIVEALIIQGILQTEIFSAQFYWITIPIGAILALISLFHIVNSLRFLFMCKKDLAT